MKGIVKKVGAGVLLGAMVMSIPSCSTSSIHPKKFRDTILEETDSTEMEFSEFAKIKDMSKIKTGVVIYEDKDPIKSMATYEKKCRDVSRMGNAFEPYVLRSEDIEGYEVKDEVFYLSIIDNEDENAANSAVDFVNAKYIRFEDREQAQAAFEDYIARMKDRVNLDIEDFDESVFELDDYEGYFVITMNEEIVAKEINVYFDDLVNALDGEPAGVRDSYLDMYADGFRVTAVTYLKGRTITTFIGWDFGDGILVAPVVDFIGIDDPFEVENDVQLYLAMAKQDFGYAIFYGIAKDYEEKEES